jgi:hypothetical protein
MRQLYEIANRMRGKSHVAKEIALECRNGIENDSYSA